MFKCSDVSNVIFFTCINAMVCAFHRLCLFNPFIVDSLIKFRKRGRGRRGKGNCHRFSSLLVDDITHNSVGGPVLSFRYGACRLFPRSACSVVGFLFCLNLKLQNTTTG